MGNQSIKSSKKQNRLRCWCTSTISIDEKSYPTFDRIRPTNDQNSQPRSSYLTDCQKSDYNLSIESILECNREYGNLIKKFQLNVYLHDYLSRLKTSKINQTFLTLFSSSTIIYPCNGMNQILTDHLQLVFISPPESILPNLSRTKYHSLIIHEQIRAKCYFIPLINSSIEPSDEEYKQKILPIDRSHVVITLENTSMINTDRISMEFEPSCVFISNDSFQTGLIRIDCEKISQEFLPFLVHSSEDNLSYLSSNLLQKWFNTLILVNQTCAMVKRFLIGDKNHITCLLKQQQSTNHENSLIFDNDLIFAALRQPPCTSLYVPSSDDQSEKLIDAFSPFFLSDNGKLCQDSIHIDYEQYSFALILSRWPNRLLENYSTHPQRSSIRKWPCKDQMNIIIEKSLLLIPDSSRDQWKINFDLIEQYLFQLMNESTLLFYILCQQFFAPTYSQRRLIKHCFLNYCEQYGLPFSKTQHQIAELIRHFLQDLAEQLEKKFLPDYFDHQKNLLHPDEDYHQWLDYIKQSLRDRVYLSTSSSSFITISTRPIVSQIFFDFTDQLFQTFRRKQSEFVLNDSILLDLHQQLSTDDLLIDKQTIEQIQRQLTYDFEINAELVHTCLNQIRKSQTSLIFHYTWTIFIQYLHTYYNVLWNL